MTATPGRLAIIGGLALAAGLTGIAAAWAGGPGLGEARADITMRYSTFGPALVTATARQPITVVLHNDDPIDHEWLVGDEGFHERHRTGTDAHHGATPTEVSVPAGPRSPRPSRSGSPGNTGSSATCPVTRPTGWSASCAWSRPAADRVAAPSGKGRGRHLKGWGRP